MIKERARQLNDKNFLGGKVVYWMSRDQRVEDNWALLYSQDLSDDVCVIFNLTDFPGANERSYDFMLKGIKEVEEDLRKLDIPFFLLEGKPEDSIPEFIEKNNIKAIVTDFSPLKVSRKWKKDVFQKIDLPFFEVDAHNVIPCWHASDKKEYAAYTIRPKIHRQLSRFMDDFPEVKKGKGKSKKVDWDNIKLDIDDSVKKVDWIKPGAKAAKKMLKDFIEDKLSEYHLKRNNPNADGISNLSPYLHFGQISAQRVAMEVVKANPPDDSFLEELVVRRELADNFCFYEIDYDNPKGFSDWAKKTLKEHEYDPREYVYSREEFEKAKTHDDLWNAAQMEMVKTGKMHGYVRMYWAKKILEWSSSPEEAMKIAIYLNDKYELDGRDPNGYVGVAWSIGAVHDRAWFKRPVFGMVRFMAISGMKKKFDVEKYINKNLSSFS
jgi:deoxyribodipyrimidine photo-lyase